MAATSSCFMKSPKWRCLVNCLAASLLTVAVAGCGGSVPPVQPEAQAEPEPAPQPETFVARKVEVVPVDGTDTVVTTAEQYLPVFREPGVVRIGFLAPLSGPRGALGQALLNAAQIALFDHAGDGVQLLPRDTRGQTAGATEAMNQLIAEGVDMVIGPLLGGAVRGVAPIARPARIPVVAFSNDKTTAGDGIFVMGFTPAQQVDRVIERAARDGYTRFAALVPRNAYGDVVVEALYRSVEDQAAAVAHIEYYRPGTVSSEEGSAPVQRLVTAANLDADGVPYGYDALLVAAGGTTLRTLAPLLPYYDLDPERVKFLGTQLWNDRAILGEPALLNGWFAAPPEDRFAIFAERYRNAFGSTPPRLASLGYDAVTLASSLAALPGDGDFSDAALTDPAGFTGVDGAFRFGEDGIVERSLAVYRVAPRSFDVLDPAAENFGGTSF